MTAAKRPIIEASPDDVATRVEEIFQSGEGVLSRDVPTLTWLKQDLEAAASRGVRLPTGRSLARSKSLADSRSQPRSGSLRTGCSPVGYLASTGSPSQ
jgi:hypothetical protein